MLEYAVKLTVEPWSMVEGDVVSVRRSGFSDRDILDINQVTAYYAYVNRTADGLGVGLEGKGTGEDGESGRRESESGKT
jgi:alkylhydroperoxidase family enzyme